MSNANLVDSPAPVRAPAAGPPALSGRMHGWMATLQASTDRELRQLLAVPDEAALDPGWTRALALVRAYAARPAKRVRPLLVFAGYALTRGLPAVPTGLMRFAAGIELLHTFMLIHDDVADQARTRRGADALHLQLGPGRLGEDLAIVVGDHLFARSVEGMLECGLPRAAPVVRYYLGVCRQTAAGQYLDLSVARAPLAQVPLLHTLKVAHLKTARYGFCAPMVCGAKLAGADRASLRPLERIGRQVGVAYQLADDLMGLFGDPRVTGKPSDSDFAQGKRTFPLIAAYTRATNAGRRELEALWAAEAKGERELRRARELVRRFGGVEATQRAIDVATRTARKALGALPAAGGVRDVLDELVTRLAGRSA